MNGLTNRGGIGNSVQFSVHVSYFYIMEGVWFKKSVGRIKIVCVNLCVFDQECVIIFPSYLLSVGELKSSSPSESPLMEKREMTETHSPILKSVPLETTPTPSPSAPPMPAPCEERRVTFDIGDSDDAEPKEGEISNGSGEF